MHIPDFVINAIKARPVSATVTNRQGVTVAVTHHDVGSQLGEHCTDEFYGFDEVIDLNAVKKFS